MFRFRQIKPQYLHLYEALGDGGVTQKMLDSAQCLLETEDVKVLKVFNYQHSASSTDDDAEMRDDTTTNASPEGGANIK